MRRVVLRVLTGPNQGLEQTFDEEVIPLSRLPLGRPRPQSEPAQISVTGGKAVLTDLGAPQGVFVNGRKVATAELKVGDKVELGQGGPAVEVLVIELEAPVPETRPCPNCGQPIKAAAIKCVHCRTFIEAAEPGKPEVDRDFQTEAHFLALGLWWRVFATAGLIGSLAVMIAGQAPPGVPALLIRFAGVLCAAIFGVTYAVGSGLSRLQSWARITAIVLSFVGAGLFALVLFVGIVMGRFEGPLPATVIGVFINLAVAMALLNPASARVCTEEYQKLIEQTPQLRPDISSSGFFWMYGGLFGLIVFIMILMMGGRS